MIFIDTLSSLTLTDHPAGLFRILCCCTQSWRKYPSMGKHSSPYNLNSPFRKLALPTVCSVIYIYIYTFTEFIQSNVQWHWNSFEQLSVMCFAQGPNSGGSEAWTVDLLVSSPLRYSPSHHGPTNEWTRMNKPVNTQESGFRKGIQCKKYMLNLMRIIIICNDPLQEKPKRKVRLKAGILDLLLQP